jgi:DNA-binding cell septation regulator SpoVG
MQADSIVVDLRPSSKSDSKIKAFADVTVPLGDDGTITMLGFSVLEKDGRPARVMVPARKGRQTWFNIVELNGKVRNVVEEAVLTEYERHKSELG